MGTRALPSASIAARSFRDSGGSGWQTATGSVQRAEKSLGGGKAVKGVKGSPGLGLQVPSVANRRSTQARKPPAALGLGGQDSAASSHGSGGGLGAGGTGLAVVTAIVTGPARVRSSLLPRRSESVSGSSKRSAISPSRISAGLPEPFTRIHEA